MHGSTGPFGSRRTRHRTRSGCHVPALGLKLQQEKGAVSTVGTVSTVTCGSPDRLGVDSSTSRGWGGGGGQVQLRELRRRGGGVPDTRQEHREALESAWALGPGGKGQNQDSTALRVLTRMGAGSGSPAIQTRGNHGHLLHQKAAPHPWLSFSGKVSVMEVKGQERRPSS